MNSPGKPTKGTTNILLADSKGFYSAQDIYVFQETQILKVEETLKSPSAKCLGNCCKIYSCSAFSAIMVDRELN